MQEEPVRHIKLPPSGKYPQGHQIALKDRVLVVIGANGSGKTRFGAWLDAQNYSLHHRVSANRSLVFPDRVQPMDLKEAKSLLFTGQMQSEGANIAHYKQNLRWHNNPAIAPLNDYTPLVAFMVSESFNMSDQYRVAMKSTNQYIAPPITALDKAKIVWEAVLPTRELIIAGNRIEVRNRIDTKCYHAKELSDGERGIFYLIGEALIVPEGGIFIVDEPELHLHRAIQSRLWDAVESIRPDCAFVYITHDLGFAASRKAATKVWLREYADGKWDWEQIPETDAIPESMLLELIGSRQPIMFVEGDKGSLDYFIYGKLFPDHCIMPCGSCESVIHSVKSFTKLADLHHNTCHALIDNDGRSDSDIKMLNGLGVKVIPVAIVENLFLLDSVVRIAASRMALDPDKTVDNVQSRVFEMLKKNQVKIVSNLTRQEIEAKLRLVGNCVEGAEALAASFTSACSGVDPIAIYSRWEAEITRVLNERDYSAALRYYNIKGLPALVGTIIGAKYQDLVLRWLRSNEADSFISALRAAVPQF